MTPQAIKQLQIQLGITPTGIFDESTLEAMNGAVNTAVTTLTGKPFTRAQQEEAVTAAEKALNPGFEAQNTYDRANTEDTLRSDVEGFDQFRDAEAESFKDNKEQLDQNSADQGVLFSGSRFQKLNDLRNTYADREAIRRGQTADRIRSTARNYQYNYGDDAARGLRDMYELPGTTNFNANVAGGKVTPGKSLSSVYDPGQFKFQGTVPVGQKAAVQTRAASLLGNRANKLSALGYKTQY